VSVQRDAEDARKLLVQAEAETEPDEKVAALEEALDLIDLVLEEAPEDAKERTLVANLRRSYARRLLVQLVALRSADILMWFGYAQLLLTRMREDVAAALTDPGVKAGYEAFFSLWPADVRALLDEG
jgi:hypothetical protein